MSPAAQATTRLDALRSLLGEHDVMLYGQRALAETAHEHAQASMDLSPTAETHAMCAVAYAILAHLAPKNGESA